MLRIHQFGFACVDSEKRSVEAIDAVEDPARSDVRRARASPRVEGVFERGLVDDGDAFDAVAEVLPERRDVARTGEATRKSDHGDAVLRWKDGCRTFVTRFEGGHFDQYMRRVADRPDPGKGE